MLASQGDGREDNEDVKGYAIDQRRLDHYDELKNQKVQQICKTLRQ